MTSSLPIEDLPSRVVRVLAGEDCAGEQRSLGVSVIQFKVLPQDANGLLILENRFHSPGGPARHLHLAQDEWFLVLEGEFLFEIGAERFTLSPGDSVWAPRNVPHVWAFTGGDHGRILVAFMPAGKMEAFFRDRDSSQRDAATGSRALGGARYDPARPTAGHWLTARVRVGYGCAAGCSPRLSRVSLHDSAHVHRHSGRRAVAAHGARQGIGVPCGPPAGEPRRGSGCGAWLTNCC